MKKLFGTFAVLTSALTLASCGEKDTSNYDTLKNEIDQLRDLIDSGETTGDGTSLDNVISNVYNDVKDSAVGISTSLGGNSSAVGSGTIYRKMNADTGYDYYVVTNQHVVNNGQGYSIYTFDGQIHTATLVGQTEHGEKSSATDIAVLKFNSTSSYDRIEFAYTDENNVGQFAIALGSPLSNDNLNTLTFGVLSKTHYSKIQHDVAINPGNSGGALLNTEGKLIGVNVEKYSYTGGETGFPEGMGLSIRLGFVIEGIRESENQKKLFGLSSMSVYDAIITGKSVSTAAPSRGVFIDSVTSNSISARAGFEQGDVVLSANNIDIHDNNDLLLALHKDFVIDNSYDTSDITFEYWDDTDNSIKEVTVTF